MVRIDNRDYRAALAKAEGAVAAQQALLANLDARQSLQLATIAEAKAAAAAVNADTVRAHDDQVRYANLVAKSAVSIQSSQKAAPSCAALWSRGSGTPPSSLRPPWRSFRAVWSLNGQL